LGSGERFHFEDADSPDNSFIRSVDLKSMKVSTLPNSQARLNPLLSLDGRYLAADTVDDQKLLLFDFNNQKWSELARASID
jgi:hypothetical protein